MYTLLSLTLLPILASGSPVVNPSIETIHKDAAPILSSSDSNVIPNSYMIKFKDHVTRDIAFAHHSWVHETHTKSEQQKSELRKRSQIPFVNDIFTGLKHTYDISTGFLGYSGHFDDEVIEQIRRHPDVEIIEKDSVVHTQHEFREQNELQNNAPWGLARISHRDALGLGSFNKYLYAAQGGLGVDVYVIDTGTYIDHLDFEGRAEWGATIIPGSSDKDGNGHGTHCSGTIAGKTYGVAKKAHIKAVKVLGANGAGAMSDVIKGVEYAATAHQDQAKEAKDGNRKGFKGSTANMSLGGGKSFLLDRSVDAAVDAGLHFAVAAGNDDWDSCNYSPAAAQNAVTVGASTVLDERATFSNYGPCNDIFAPGLDVLSAWIGSPTAVNTISGTSMASPHIAGLLAYLLSLQPAKDSAYAVEDISPKKLKEYLIKIGTVGVLSDVPRDTANILAWNGGGSNNLTRIAEDSLKYRHKKGKIHSALGELKDKLHGVEELIEDKFDIFEEL